MTLVLSAFNNDYVVLTSDSQIGYGEYNKDRQLISERRSEVSEIIGFKVIRVSDRVLYGMGGFKEAHDLILEKLLRRVREDDDLHKVTVLIREICDDLKKNSPLFNFTLGEGLGFGAYISGFYRNGRSGRVHLHAFGDVEITKTVNPSWGALPPPGVDGEVNMAIFSIGGKEGIPNVAEVATRFSEIHSLFAYSQPEYVSADCTIYVLQKQGKKIDFKKLTVDTSLQFEGLPTKSEVIDFLFIEE